MSAGADEVAKGALSTEALTRQLITTVVERVAAPGRSALLQQLTHAFVARGNASRVELSFTPVLPPRADLADGPLTAVPIVVDGCGEASGELLIWVKDGLLAEMEYAWWSDVAPETFSSVNDLSSTLRNQRTNRLCR